MHLVLFLPGVWTGDPRQVQEKTKVERGKRTPRVPQRDPDGQAGAIPGVAHPKR